MSWWKMPYVNNNGEYEIVFASTFWEQAKAVEKVCDAVMRGKCENPDDVQIVRHGKWIPDEYYYDNEIWKCSACGEEWCFEAGTPTENGANFCPQCGAKMDGD